MHCARVVALFARGDHRFVVAARDGHGHVVRCAVHALDGEGLNLGFTRAQVLHFAVVDVVGPGAVSRDAQAAQGIRARGNAGRVSLERHFIRAVHVADLQLAAVAQ